jgi:hypothetical protein
MNDLQQGGEQIAQSMAARVMGERGDTLKKGGQNIIRQMY